MSYKSALREYAAQIKASLPADIRELIKRANNDLYTGPRYYDADGNECSCFDDGAIAFDFSAACDKIRDALDSVTTVYIDENDCVSEVEPKGFWYDPETGSDAEPVQGDDESDDEFQERRESAWQESVPYYVVEPREIIRAILGT